MFLQHLRFPNHGVDIHILGPDIELPPIAEVEQESDAHTLVQGEIADFDLVGRRIVGIAGRTRVIDFEETAETIFATL